MWSAKGQQTSMKDSVPPQKSLFCTSAWPGLTMHSEADYIPANRGGDWVRGPRAVSVMHPRRET